MAYEFYMQIEGQKQGKLKGESTREAWKDWAPCYYIEYSANVPTDRDRGTAAGAVRHMPITVSKEWGASSPQIFTALCTNEVLKKVTFSFTHRNKDGTEEVYYTIVLVNAVITEYKQYTPEASKTEHQQMTTKELENVSFRFQQITVTHKVAKTEATFNWDAK